MITNWLVILGSALIPFFVAFVWFHEKVFGGEKWHLISEMSIEKAASPVSPFKLFLSILLNAFIAFGVYLLTIHETGIFGMVGGNQELMNAGTAAAFLAEYGGAYHTLTHGLAHGLAATLFFAFPILGYVVIFEKKSGKYFWVYLSYWYVSLTLMSVVISLWAVSML